MDRFLLAENPMTGNNIAIIQTTEPQAIIEVHEGHVAFKPGVFYGHFDFVNCDGVPEFYTLRVHHCFVTEFDGEKHGEIVTKLLTKAWHWYMSYMNWEDAQINENENL